MQLLRQGDRPLAVQRNGYVTVLPGGLPGGFIPDYRSSVTGLIISTVLNAATTTTYVIPVDLGALFPDQALFIKRLSLFAVNDGAVPAHPNKMVASRPQFSSGAVADWRGHMELDNNRNECFPNVVYAKNHYFAIVWQVNNFDPVNNVTLRGEFEAEAWDDPQNNWGVGQNIPPTLLTVPSLYGV